MTRSKRDSIAAEALLVGVCIIRTSVPSAQNGRGRLRAQIRCWPTSTAAFARSSRSIGEPIPVGTTVAWIHPVSA